MAELDLMYEKLAQLESDFDEGKITEWEYIEKCKELSIPVAEIMDDKDWCAIEDKDIPGLGEDHGVDEDPEVVRERLIQEQERLFANYEDDEELLHAILIAMMFFIKKFID